MSKTIIQFAFKDGKPEHGPILDCRAIPNPYRHGVSHNVLIDRVKAMPQYPSLVQHGVRLLKEFDTIYVGCTYGKHRSGAVAAGIAEITGAEVRHD